MTTPIQTNPQAQCQAYDFKPSYNAVQLNLSQPTLNVPQVPMAPMPQDTQKSWIA